VTNYDVSLKVRYLSLKDNEYFNWSNLQKSGLTFASINFIFIGMYLNEVSFISTVSSLSLMLLLVSVVMSYFQKDVNPK